MNSRRKQCGHVGPDEDMDWIDWAMMLGGLLVLVAVAVMVVYI